MAEVISNADLDVATSRAVDVLRTGGLVVMPTDTVYAIVADAFQTNATQRLLGAKGRGREVPLSILIRNPRQVIGLAAEVPETAERLMASYWPGPVALVLEEQAEMPWDLGHTDGAITLRMPADDLLLAIAAEIGPLACSAANRRGEPPAKTVGEAQLQLGENVDLYVAGPPSQGAVTTVVDCTRAEAQVLREGAIPSADILSVAAGEVSWGARPDAQPGAEPEAAPEEEKEA